MENKRPWKIESLKGKLSQPTAVANVASKDLPYPRLTKKSIAALYNYWHMLDHPFQ